MIKDYLRLMRPANMVTSVADVLAGIAVTHSFSSNFEWLRIAALCASTACLYGGGVVYNDVFDADLDMIERPERPIPSGAVTVAEAKRLGFVLLLVGIMLAGFMGTLPGLIAVAIALFALLYDKWGKHNSFIGPLNMGICRGLNLLLGISIIPTFLNEWYFLAAAPVVYIFAITLISRGEVHGGGKRNLYIATILYTAVIAFILHFALVNDRLYVVLVFLAAFVYMAFKPLLAAIEKPTGANIGKSVKAGVLALILLDAAWTATFDSIFVAVIVALLLVASFGLAEVFAVT